MFVFLLISGFGALYPCLCYRYYCVNTSKTWDEAQSYCRNNFTDLAKIDNLDALRNQSTNECKDNEAWIGLRGNWKWSSGEQVVNLIWARGEPNNVNNEENCGVIGPSGLHDFSCNNSFPFVCYNESFHRHIPVQENKTWNAARDFCRENHTDLARVESPNELNITEKLKSKRWWIGLFKNWEWSDQSLWKNQINPGGFGKLENPICVTVFSNLTSTKDCRKENYFFCYEDHLVLVKENKTWDEALNYCRQQHEDLVSVSSETVQHWVKRRAQSATTDHVWLGLRFSCGLRYWHWVSGEGFCHQQWPSWPLEYQCGHTGAVGSGANQRWVSLPKTNKFNFICSKVRG